jgi:hypothetical protein
MKKQKLNSKTFHEAAAKIVDQYFGEIPFFVLKTSTDVKTEKGKTEQQFTVWYKNLRYRADTPDFWGCQSTPDLALVNFENDIQIFFGLPISKQDPEIIPFGLPY